MGRRTRKKYLLKDLKEKHLASKNLFVYEICSTHEKNFLKRIIQISKYAFQASLELEYAL